MDTRTADALYAGYAERTLRVLSKETGSGGSYVPLRLNKVQRHQLWLQQTTKRRRFLNLKARQMGMTTYYKGLHLQRCQMIGGYRVGLVGLRGKGGVEDIGAEMRQMLAMQPKEWREQAPRLTSETDTLLRWENGSAIHFFTQGGGFVGTGLTFNLLHFTEYAKYDSPALTRGSILPALVPGGTEVIESSALGYNHFQELVADARADPDPLYQFVFYPWWWAEEYRTAAPPTFSPTNEEEVLIQRHGLTPEQLAFRREKKKELGRLFPQEFAEDPDEAFLASGDSVFGYELRERIKAGCTPPTRTDFDGYLSVWGEPLGGVSYVIGADCAEGVPGGDLSAGVVLRADSGRHVATLMDHPSHPAARNGRLAPQAFARLLATVGRLYNDAGMMVELNGPGSGVINSLHETHRYEAMLTPFRTTPASKSAAKTGFIESLENESFVTSDERLPRQMADFIVLETSATYEKVGARRGAKDDLLMAAMIGNDARAQALVLARRGPMVV